MNTAERVMFLLKTHGELTAQALAERLELTAMGARKQLLALEEKALAEAVERPQGVGRPAQFWRLTERGHGRFPDRHGDLAVQLLQSVSQLFGAEGMGRLIDLRERQALEAYQAALRAEPDLAARVERLAQLRSGEGYMAQALADGDGWLLLENHCPICAAARQCQDFCRSELQLFAAALGPDARVSRVEHVLAGGRRCVYRIAPAG